MSQPPQDRPDYPWGPGEDDRATAAPSAPVHGEVPGPLETGRLGGSTRMGAGSPEGTSLGGARSEETRVIAPASSSSEGPGPYTGTAYTGTPYTGTPYTGGPSPAAPALGGSYTGIPTDQHRGTGTGEGVPVSTIVLLVLSGLAVFTGWFTLAGIPAVILAIVALTRAGSDPTGARRLTRIGWWVFAGLVVLGLVLGAIGLALLFALPFGGLGGFGGGPTFSGVSTAALTGTAW